MGKRHGGRSDFEKVKYALQEAKAENRRLTKENHRLNKELQKNINSLYTVELDEELFEDVPLKRYTCPKCKSEEIQDVQAGKFLITVCKDCGYKKRKVDKQK